jgi:hypothetical protein
MEPGVAEFLLPEEREVWATAGTLTRTLLRKIARLRKTLERLAERCEAEGVVDSPHYLCVDSNDVHELAERGLALSGWKRA